jgi:hypothetical protein
LWQEQVSTHELAQIYGIKLISEVPLHVNSGQNNTQVTYLGATSDGCMGMKGFKTKYLKYAVPIAFSQQFWWDCTASTLVKGSDMYLWHKNMLKVILKTYGDDLGITWKTVQHCIHDSHVQAKNNREFLDDFIKNNCSNMEKAADWHG